MFPNFKKQTRLEKGSICAVSSFKCALESLLNRQILSISLCKNKAIDAIGQKKFLLLSLFVCPFLSFTALFSQETLTISIGRCLYEATTAPRIVQLSPPETAIVELKDELLRQTQRTANFSLYAANVPSVAAVVVGNARYVLYNPSYFKSLSPLRQAVLLAHAIGHHAQKHGFHDGFEADEELEADEFAGTALYFSDFEKDAILANLTPIHRINDVEARKKAFAIGLKRGEDLLKINPNAGFSKEEIEKMLKDMPVFTLPPPTPSAEMDLTAFFSTCSKYESANGLLLKALDETGYFSKKHYRTSNNGFAIIAKMEQFNKDGTSKQGAARWSMKSVGNEGFSEYVKSMFFPQIGLFRVIVFVVDDNYKGNNSGVSLNRDTALAWLNSGYTSLPSVIGDKPFLRNATKVNALIYEFKVPETNKTVDFSKPSELDGRTHLQKALILSKIKN